MHFQPMAVGLEPSPDVSLFMVGSVVLNQNGPLAAIAPSELFEQEQITDGIKSRVKPIIEARTPEFDGTEDLHALALSGHGHFWWATDAAPGGM